MDNKNLRVLFFLVITLTTILGYAKLAVAFDFPPPLGFYRNGTFYLKNSSGGVADNVFLFGF